jgi:hypothetical protein
MELSVEFRKVYRLDLLLKRTVFRHKACSANVIFPSQVHIEEELEVYPSTFVEVQEC